MYDHTGISFISVPMKMSGHCGVIIVFDVKNMTLESIYSLSYIFYVAQVAF